MSEVTRILSAIEQGDPQAAEQLLLCHEKSGERQKARDWYDRATRWMDMNQPNNAELRRLRAEAVQVLEVERKKTGISNTHGVSALVASDP